eukprot:765790-Hanusia_phi.AAC.11
MFSSAKSKLSAFHLRPHLRSLRHHQYNLHRLDGSDCLSVEGEEVDRWAGLVEEDLNAMASSLLPSRQTPDRTHRPVVVHKEAGPFRACATARLVQLSCRPAEVVSLHLFSTRPAAPFSPRW